MKYFWSFLGVVVVLVVVFFVLIFSFRSWQEAERGLARAEEAILDVQGNLDRCNQIVLAEARKNSGDAAVAAGKASMEAETKAKPKPAVKQPKPSVAELAKKVVDSERDFFLFLNTAAVETSVLTGRSSDGGRSYWKIPVELANETFRYHERLVKSLETMRNALGEVKPGTSGESMARFVASRKLETILSSGEWEKGTSKNLGIPVAGSALLYVERGRSGSDFWPEQVVEATALANSLADKN